jgi:hypothetical protein
MKKTDEDRIRLSRAAQRMLDDDLLGHVLESMRESYIAAWLNTDPANVSQREEAWRRCQLLPDFLAHLQILADEKEFIQQH